MARLGCERSRVPLQVPLEHRHHISKIRLDSLAAGRLVATYESGGAEETLQLQQSQSRSESGSTQVLELIYEPRDGASALAMHHLQRIKEIEQQVWREVHSGLFAKGHVCVLLRAVVVPVAFSHIATLSYALHPWFRRSRRWSVCTTLWRHTLLGGSTCHSRQCQQSPWRDNDKTKNDDGVETDSDLPPESWPVPKKCVKIIFSLANKKRYSAAEPSPDVFWTNHAALNGFFSGLKSGLLHSFFCNVSGSPTRQNWGLMVRGDTISTNALWMFRRGRELHQREKHFECP